MCNARQGFPVFLAAADGTRVNSEKISNLTSLRWIDKNTRSLQVGACAARVLVGDQAVSVNRCALSVAPCILCEEI